MTRRPVPTPTALRAIGYVRVSSQQQAESGLSLEHQNTKVRAAASLHDMTMVDVIVDAAESAANLKRPGVTRVLDMVRARAVDVVIVTKLDRLTRSVRDLADLLELFAAKKVALVSVSESLDTSSAAGRMVVNMLGVVSQWERETISERTKAAMVAKRARGERCGCIPFGKRLAADGRNLEPHHEEHDLLLFAVECRHAYGFTWQATADALNREGYRTRAGSTWTWEGIRSALRTHDRHTVEALERGPRRGSAQPAA